MVQYMHQLFNYDYYIFDCDGVIFNSNKLKISAMHNSLLQLIDNSKEIDECVEYFQNNFGKSRYHHVDIFLADYITLKDVDRFHLRDEILRSYSMQCKELYLQAELTPGFIDFIGSLSGNKYVASGSDQGELRDVFKHKGLDNLFNGIYGSPVSKSENIKKIINKECNSRTVIFGDALSDLHASVDNKIDFIGYTPYSNVRAELIFESSRINACTISDWSELEYKDTNCVKF